jgi:hypothetical protein
MLLVWLRNEVVLTSALAFRADFLPFIRRPIPEGWDVGSWIAMMIGRLTALSLITDPLVKYRQHGRNPVGMRKRTFAQGLKRTQELRQSSTLAQKEDLFVRLYECVAGFDSSSLRPGTLALLDAKMRICIFGPTCQSPDSNVCRLSCESF